MLGIIFTVTLSAIIGYGIYAEVLSMLITGIIGIIALFLEGSMRAGGVPNYICVATIIGTTVYGIYLFYVNHMPLGAT